MTGGGGPPPSRVTIACSGHPEITATHDKTLELSVDADISRRASCVVGVGAAYDRDHLLALRGRIRVAIDCDGERDVFEATASSFFDGHGSLVFRRGPTLRGRTFAAHTEKTAAGLNRRLVERLRAPDASVTVTIEPVDQPEPAPDTVFVACVDEGVPPSSLVGWEDVIGPVTGRAQATVVMRVGPGGRMLVVAPPGRTHLMRAAVIVSGAYDEGAEVQGLPGAREPETMLLAAGTGGGGYVFLDHLPKRPPERRRLLRSALNARLPLAATAGAERIAGAVAEVAALDPGAVVTVTRRRGTIHETVLRGVAGEVAALPGLERPGPEPAWLVVAPTEAPFGRDLEALVAALRREGVSERTLVLAVQSATGESRSRAYELVRRDDP